MSFLYDFAHYDGYTRVGVGVGSMQTSRSCGLFLFYSEGQTQTCVYEFCHNTPVYISLSQEVLILLLFMYFH